MGGWESIFKEKGKFFYKPHEDLNKLTKIFKKNNIRKILDLGCGTGRHTVFLAKKGFDVYGSDVSKSGISQTRKWLKEKNLKANLKVSDCYKKFPYKKDFFDAILSIQVIHHATIENIQFCISEIKRTLKPAGLAFITVAKTRKNKFRTKNKTIAPRTFVPLNGHETGVPHYIFNKEILRKEFRDFKILELYEDSGKHYCILAQLKE